MKIKSTFIFLAIASVLFNGCVVVSKEKKSTANSLSVFDSKEAKALYLDSYNKTLNIWPVAFDETDVKTSFGTAHVIMSGPKNGAPLILLHGMNASSTMWYPNIKALSQNNRVYAIDFILEPGKSVPIKELENKEDIVSWYNEIFDHFGFKKVSIVGASRGGWLAINIALSQQQNIDKIILLSPAQTFSSLKLKPKVISNISFALFPKRVRLRKILKTLSYDVDKIPQLFINQFYIASKNAGISSSVLKMLPFSNDELKALNMPVLLLIGDHDIINNEHSLNKAKELLPHVEAHMIPSTGHFLTCDQPDIINKRIVDFLQKKM